MIKVLEFVCIFAANEIIRKKTVKPKTTYYLAFEQREDKIVSCAKKLLEFIDLPN